MTSIIHVGQSKFIMVPIDEDSHECILDYIQTLCELEATPVVHGTFLKDTKMLDAQEVKFLSRL